MPAIGCMRLVVGIRMAATMGRLIALSPGGAAAFKRFGPESSEAASGTISALGLQASRKSSSRAGAGLAFHLPPTRHLLDCLGRYATRGSSARSWVSTYPCGFRSNRAAGAAKVRPQATRRIPVPTGCGDGHGRIALDWHITCGKTPTGEEHPTSRAQR